MQSLECVELLLFVLLPKMSVPDIKNRGLRPNHGIDQVQTTIITTVNYV